MPGRIRQDSGEERRGEGKRGREGCDGRGGEGNREVLGEVGVGEEEGEGEVRRRIIWQPLERVQASGIIWQPRWEVLRFAELRCRFTKCF